jgi:hypothetical protein
MVSRSLAASWSRKVFVPVGVERLEVALPGGEPLRGVQDVGPPLRGGLL